MAFTYSNHTLEKLETLLKSLGFKLRYEKGNFKTGACVLETNRIVIVNKFSNLESKINSLTVLIQNTETDENLLDDKQKAFLYMLKQTELKF